jgi:hypothetical protein
MIFLFLLFYTTFRLIFYLMICLDEVLVLGSSRYLLLMSETVGIEDVELVWL